jgi:RNA polymerase sigma factor (sigma-70 family)
MPRRSKLSHSAEFTRFYGQHSDPLAVWFARRTLDAETAVDLTAETFAQAYLSRRRYRGNSEREAAGWLYSIARHQLSRYHRKGRAERKALERLGADLPRLQPAEIERIEELAEIESSRQNLRDGLDRLTAKQRQAIAFRVVDELSYPEVARRLGTSEQTARARVSRGLRSLEEILTASQNSKETAQ